MTSNSLLAIDQEDVSEPEVDPVPKIPLHFPVASNRSDSKINRAFMAESRGRAPIIMARLLKPPPTFHF